MTPINKCSAMRSVPVFAWLLEGDQLKKKNWKKEQNWKLNSWIMKIIKSKSKLGTFSWDLNVTP